MGAPKVRHTRTSKKGLVFAAGTKTFSWLIGEEDVTRNLESTKDIKNLYDALNDHEVANITVNSNYAMLHNFCAIKRGTTPQDLTFHDMLLTLGEIWGAKVSRKGKPDFNTVTLLVEKGNK